MNASTLLIILLFLSSVARAAVDPGIKDPNVAGGFYPADPQELSTLIDRLMANSLVKAEDIPVQIAISPHAGYVYSGSVAADAFKALTKHRYSTIIVVAPSHYDSFSGASIWPKGGFQTPLGIISVDESMARELLASTSVLKDYPKAFDQEHALEVQLPFIQKTFPKAKIVPIVMGQPDLKVSEDLARALDKAMGTRSDILVLISSDMSHYHPYDAANAMDAQTLRIIGEGNIEGFWDGMIDRRIEMCGFVPVVVGMILAHLRGDSVVQVLKYANSGDTAGDKTRVVGYSSILFHQPSELTKEQKNRLLHLARSTVEAFVRTKQIPNLIENDSRLNKVQGAFVTINKDGQLRGCIGNIIGEAPLALTVRDMAISAASQDPRFPPVTVDELDHIDLEVSVLSIPKRIASADEIVLGRDGVIVSDGGVHQGVFLPQVATETGWSKEQFLSELCSQKSGLAGDCWKDSKTALYTFTAEVFGEE